ncbi:hypothetical protein I7I53_02276 [Histoplasma capsulatum var. duboisii H88]|uniref:Uncharacterized protein n=1 Tax=Ajellomyces capsulatus (strain H88) TaxID=544711 RepID=A0A8A1LL47_AJEC8|nr:hypothetical protein I7I53_02276 [Histoplasma capsulatum var. duboisii H88]
MLPQTNYSRSRENAGPIIDFPSVVRCGAVWCGAGGCGAVNRHAAARSVADTHIKKTYIQCKRFNSPSASKGRESKKKIIISLFTI